MSVVGILHVEPSHVVSVRTNKPSVGHIAYVCVNFDIYII